MTRATIPHIGYSLLLFATLMAAAFIGAASAAVRSTAMLPGWVARSGLVAKELLHFSIFFMPMIAMPVWVLAVGISLWRSNSPGEPAGQGT